MVKVIQVKIQEQAVAERRIQNLPWSIEVRIYRILIKLKQQFKLIKD